LKSFIGSRYNLYKNLLRTTTIEDEQFLQSSETKNIQMCSDGGSEERRVSFGITVHCNNKTALTISNRVPKIYNPSNSHRSECFGLLASVQIILLIQQYLEYMNVPIRPQEILLCCDYKSAVDTINKLKNQKITVKMQWTSNMDIIKKASLKVSIKQKQKIVKSKLIISKVIKIDKIKS
jgi:hypothetical protein